MAAAKPFKEKGNLAGFLQKKSGRKSITYEEAIKEALCLGWIDG